MNTLRHWARVGAAVLALVLLCACGVRDYAWDVPVQLPDPGVSPLYRKAPYEIQDAYTVLLDPAVGPDVRFSSQGMAAEVLQTLAQADGSLEHLADLAYDNTLSFTDGQGRTLYRYALSSEGSGILKSDDGRMAYMPQYLYHTLQWNVWQVTGYLRAPLRWDPKKQNIALLQSQLGDMLTTIQVHTLGYAEAYFVNYKIYDYVLSEKDTQLKLYLMVAFAGYELQDDTFARVLLDVRPAQIVFTLDEDETWRPIAYRQAQDSTDYDSVRNVLPYDYARQAMDEYTARATFVADLTRQARDYLRARGYSGITVEE